jgi:hypothetical protein
LVTANPGETPAPIKPYTAVGLIPTVRGIRKRADIRVNLEHLKHLVKAAAWLSSLDLPVRVIAIPEGALQGFNDEVLDLDHAQFAREGAIDIPGEERKSSANSRANTIPSSLPRRKPGIPTGRIDSSMWASSSTLGARSSCSTTRCHRYFRSRTRCVRMTSMTGGCRNTGGRCRRSGQWSTPTSGV